MRFCYYVSFNLKNEFEFEKFQKTNYFVQQEIYKNDFNHLILLTFSATNVNRFKFLIIHNNNDKSKTSK